MGTWGGGGGAGGCGRAGSGGRGGAAGESKGRCLGQNGWFRRELPLTRHNYVDINSFVNRGNTRGWRSARAPKTQKSKSNRKGTDRAVSCTKDHAMLVVRYAGRRRGEILRIRVQEFQNRKNQPLRKRGIRNQWEDGGDGHDRRVRHRRAEIFSAQLRPPVQVQRGGIVPSALRNTGRDRLLLEQACRRRRGRTLRLAQGQVRPVVADHSDGAAAAADG